MPNKQRMLQRRYVSGMHKAFGKENKRKEKKKRSRYRNATVSNRKHDEENTELKDMKLVSSANLEAHLADGCPRLGALEPLPVLAVDELSAAGNHRRHLTVAVRRGALGPSTSQYGSLGQHLGLVMTIA